MHLAHCVQKMFRIFIAELMLVVYQGLPTRLYYDDKSGTQGFLLCVCAKVNNCQSTAAAEESIDKVVLVGRGGGRGQNCGHIAVIALITPHQPRCAIYTHTNINQPQCTHQAAIYTHLHYR